MSKLPIITALLVGALLGALALAAVSAQTAPDDDLQLRLSIRKLADGRVEVGLQQQRGDEWSERILPDDRFLPAEAEPEQWQDTAPFSLRAPASDRTPEDRVINALAAAPPPAPDPVEPPPAVEPAPPQPIPAQTYTVQPGDQLAHIAREHGINLYDLIALNDLQTPDLIRVDQEIIVRPAAEQPPPTPTDELSEATDAEPSDTEAEAEPSYTPVQAAPTATESGVVYGTIHDQQRNLVHSLVIAPADAAPPQLVVSCAHGRLSVQLDGLPAAALSADSAAVYASIDNGPLTYARWSIHPGGAAVSDNPQAFINALQNAANLRLRIELANQTIPAAFQVADLLTTPIQPNLNACSAPPPSQSQPAD